MFVIKYLKKKTKSFVEIEGKVFTKAVQPIAKKVNHTTKQHNFEYHFYLSFP